MSVKQRFSAVCAILFCVALYSSCKGDETRFSEDSVALAKVRALSAKLNSGQQLSEQEFNDLKAEFEKYPKAESLQKPYEAALFLRKDWASLAEFYRSLQGEDFTEFREKNLAKVFVKLGNYEEASKIASKFDLKKDEEMRLVAASSFFHTGRYAEAKRLLDDSWESIVSQKRLDEMVLRGMIYFYEGENKKALEVLEKVITFDPLNVTANNGLSRVYAAEGNTEKAKAAQLKVQESFDKITEHEQVKTRIVEKSNRLEEAYQAKRYNEVISLSRELIPHADPRNRMIMYQYLYNSYMALGKQNEARAVMEEAKQFQQK